MKYGPIYQESDSIVFCIYEALLFASVSNATFQESMLAIASFPEPNPTPTKPMAIDGDSNITSRENGANECSIQRLCLTFPPFLATKHTQPPCARRARSSVRQFGCFAAPALMMARI
jgi:hypothetical protein